MPQSRADVDIVATGAARLNKVSDAFQVECRVPAGISEYTGRSIDDLDLRIGPAMHKCWWEQRMQVRADVGHVWLEEVRGVHAAPPSFDDAARNAG